LSRVTSIISKLYLSNTKTLFVLKDDFSSFLEKYHFLIVSDSIDSRTLLQASQYYPVEIIKDFLFMGDQNSVLLINDLKIDYILNLTSTVINEDEIEKDTKVLQVEFDDTEDEKLPVKECVGFIEKASAEKKRCLVYCFNGCTRSPSIVCAYVMKRNKKVDKPSLSVSTGNYLD
jgi:protein-tyrosine phosphatase